jgi:hypothetical protein
MGLTISQIESLMAPTNDPRKKKYNAIVRTAEGLEQQQVKTSQFGRFEGKAGTKRRSRKGMVRTMPNGSRYYNGITEVEVVMYQV